MHNHSLLHQQIHNQCLFGCKPKNHFHVYWWTHLLSHEAHPQYQNILNLYVDKHSNFHSSRSLNYKLFTRTTRDHFQRIIIKAAANDNYPFESGAHIRDAYCHTLSQDAHLHLDERSYEACEMYVNGQYWGVYEIREKVDDKDFTSYNYSQDEPNIQMLKT